MLPEYFKLHILNDTGATIEFSTDGANNTFTVTGLPFNRDANGALVFGAEATLFADPTVDLADAADLEASAEYDNSSNLYDGFLCRAHLETDAAVAGAIEIYWEWSTGGGAAGVYPSDAADFDGDTIQKDLTLAAVLSATVAADDRDTNFILCLPG